MSRRPLIPDAATPRQQKWLDRYAETCPSRRGFFLYNGGFYKRLRPHNSTRTFNYGRCPMDWAWIKSEVRKHEARERRIDRKMVGAFI